MDLGFSLVSEDYVRFGAATSTWAEEFLQVSTFTMGNVASVVGAIVVEAIIDLFGRIARIARPNPRGFPAPARLVPLILGVGIGPIALYYLWHRDVYRCPICRERMTWNSLLRHYRRHRCRRIQWQQQCLELEEED